MVECSITEAAKLLGISEAAVRKRIKAGKLVAELHGRQWKVLLPGILFTDSHKASGEIAEGEILEPSAIIEQPTLPEPETSENIALRGVDSPPDSPHISVNHAYGPLPDLNQVITRAGAEYIDTVRTLSADLVRRYDVTSAVASTHMAVQSQEAEVAEAGPEVAPIPVQENQPQSKRLEAPIQESGGVHEAKPTPPEPALSSWVEPVHEIDASPVTVPVSQPPLERAREVGAAEAEPPAYIAAPRPLSAVGEEEPVAQALLGAVQFPVGNLVQRPVINTSAAAPVRPSDTLLLEFLHTGPETTSLEPDEPLDTTSSPQPPVSTVLGTVEQTDEPIEQDERRRQRLLVLVPLILALLCGLLTVAAYFFNRPATSLSPGAGAAASLQARVPIVPVAEAAELLLASSSAQSLSSVDVSATTSLPLISGTAPSASADAQSLSDGVRHDVSVAATPSPDETARANSSEQSAPGLNAEPQPAARSSASTTETPSSGQRRAATNPAQTATTILSQVAAAEAALRSGQFEVALDYGQGPQSTAQLRFDLGAGDGTPSLAIATTYQSEAGPATLERITVGERGWERKDSGDWSALPPQKGAWDQILSFLPHAASATSPQITFPASNMAELRWYDAARDADVLLLVDALSGTPRELRRTARATGVVLDVVYSGWNSAVSIQAPVQS